MALISRTGSLLAIVAALAAPANGQDFARLGGPFSRVVVLNAPFSADATTRVQELSPDGTARLHTVIARYYRDSQGQVRAEVDTPWGPYVVVASPGPERVEFFVLDPTKRTYRIEGLGSQHSCSTARVAWRCLSGRSASNIHRAWLRACQTLSGSEPSTRRCRRTSAS